MATDAAAGKGGLSAEFWAIIGIGVMLAAPRYPTATEVLRQDCSLRALRRRSCKSRHMTFEQGRSFTRR